MKDVHSIKVAALYRFVSFAAPETLQPLILEQCNASGIKGTILLAHEGINGTVAGAPEVIDVVDALRLQECGRFFAANAAGAEHC